MSRYTHSVHPHPLFCWEVEPPTKFSKREGGLTGPQLCEGVDGKEGRNFFQGGLQFYEEKKTKSKIFNNKRSL